MADRRRQVIQLLGSRYDGLYLPPGSLVTRAGLAPQEREPCTSCGGVRLVDDFGKEIRRRKGRGYTLDRFGRQQPCTSCGEAGWIARDPMDSAGVRVGSSTTTSTARPRKTVRCDACNGEGVRAAERCTRCDGTGRRDLHVFELALDTRDVDERDPLAESIDARNQSGSYAELDRALAGVAHHVNKPPLYAPITVHAARAIRLLDEVFLPPASRTLEQLDQGEQRLVELTLGYLVSRMPASIRVPADVQANHREQREWAKRAKGRGTDRRALEQRDREIRQLIRHGRPTQWVAQQFALSVAQVNSIVRGSAA